MLCRPAVETRPVAFWTMVHPLWLKSRATIVEKWQPSETGTLPELQPRRTKPTTTMSVLDDSSSVGRHVAKGERTATASAKPPTQGEPAQGEPAQGEHVQRENASTRSAMPARYSKVFRKAAGILKHPVAPHDQWHINWSIMGQQTLGMNCEAYSLVLLDVGSGLGAVINTRMC